MVKKRLLIDYARVSGFFGISAVLAVVAVVAIALKAFERDFIRTTNAELQHISSGILTTLEVWRGNLTGSAFVVAANPDILAAIERGDRESLGRTAAEFSYALGVDGLLFTDSLGTVIAGTEGTFRGGEDISRFASVRAALGRRSAMNYEPFGSSPFAEVYASPVVGGGGEVMGTVVLCYDLTRSDFMDVMRGFGVESTVFSGDRRVSSTLLAVVGTKIANPLVEEAVLSGGRTFVGQVSVNGTEFYSVYAPLKNDDGAVAGMLFVAREIRMIRTVTAEIMRLVLPFGIFIALALAAVLTRRAVMERRALRLLRRQVNWDALTGANSRQFGTDELSHSFENYKAGLPSPAVMMLDVDNFKSVNDTFGHDAGDEVLKKIVGAIYSNCRSSDKIIRWGGDEFVGIFDGMKRDVCRHLMENILSSVSQIPFSFGGEDFRVTVSIGFAYFQPSDFGYEAVLSRADDALYHSKAHGKNSACIAAER